MSKKLRLKLGGPDWLILRAIMQLIALILLFSLAGCYGETVIKPFPESWDPVMAVTADQCPDIAGQYVNEDGRNKWDACHLQGRTNWLKAAWNCDETLAGNLLKMKAVDLRELSHARNASLVKLQQPDPNTLEVCLPGEAPKIFKRSEGDFDCDSSSLKFSMTGSAFSLEESSTAGAIVWTMGELLLLPGGVGVVSTERVFRPLQDGSLSMEATESRWVTALGIYNLHDKRNTFVRWNRYQPPATPTSTQVSPSSP